MFTILAGFYKTGAMTFTIGSDQLPGVYRSYTSLSEAAAEVGISRICLGIHWGFDNTFGQATGRQVGEYVFNAQLWANSAHLHSSSWEGVFGSPSERNVTKVIVGH